MAKEKSADSQDLINRVKFVSLDGRRGTVLKGTAVLDEEMPVPDAINTASAMIHATHERIATVCDGCPRRGPAKVTSDVYRKGWEGIWGKTRQDDLPN